MATGQEELASVTVEEDFRRAYEEGDLKAVYAKLEEKLIEYRKIPLSIAISGQTGAGKSTFVNAIRCLKAGQEGSAPVGVTQTTVGRTAYHDPNNPNLTYWDIPGVDSPDFPRKTYLKTIRFHEYDAFIILTKDRFKNSDLWLAREVRNQNKKFFFARTSVHRSIKDQKKASVDPKSDEVYLEEMKTEIKDNLGVLYQEDSVFLIDSLKPSLYDLDRLQAHLVQELPKLKRDAMTLSLTVTGEKMIELKASAILEKIMFASGFSGLVALLPIPAVSSLTDLVLAQQMVVLMSEQLGVDQDFSTWAAVTLAKSMAKELGMNLGTKLFAEGGSQDGITSYFIQVPASILSTKRLLDAILEELVEKAKKKLRDKIKHGMDSD